jgi:hypothetical protein
MAKVAQIATRTPVQLESLRQIAVHGHFARKPIVLELASDASGHRSSEPIRAIQHRQRDGW